jgi:hypothetical protein
MKKEKTYLFSPISVEEKICVFRHARKCLPPCTCLIPHIKIKKIETADKVCHSPLKACWFDTANFVPHEKNHAENFQIH